MRFVADGPSIPDDLLLARDQGRVVFFCGAGVSRAQANLPDFFGLAERVVATLGVPADSAARKLILAAQEMENRVGVPGVISADRVFGLLERDFLSQDIESAVASALTPLPNCSLRAHEILLDLATSPEGIVRLVTTNFDRLFNDCSRSVQTWQPPRLPDPARPSEMNGIIYLHGRATERYDGAEGDGFVLSSSEFGRAYLSEGWATSFVHEIIKRYVVVFVGYTADDPPVQYLLEALNRSSGQLEGVYAFQSGDANDAAARWRHKGVTAIAYDPANAHQALWHTLELWAERAKNPDRWYSDVIHSAKLGPEALAQYQRGQVAHVVSTVEGARKFLDEDDPPPAEWLCVFDPNRRYDRPGRLNEFEDQSLYVDPFDFYGLDSDIPPSKVDSTDYSTKRIAPAAAWNAFAMNRLDRDNLREDNFSAVRGHWAINIPRLAPRLAQIGMWIAKVSHQPAAVWWAGHQTSMHDDILHQIRWALENSNRVWTTDVRKAWFFLFEAWERKKGDTHSDWFALKAKIARDGWDSSVVRQYGDILQPRFDVSSNFWTGPKAPSASSKPLIGELIRRDVKYPDRFDEIPIPDLWLAPITRVLRHNLEVALALEAEIGGYGLANISPIIPDDDSAVDSYGRTNGLSGAVIVFSNIFARLTASDPNAARTEFSCWPANDDTVFARLRIWAAGTLEAVSGLEFENVLRSLSDKAFWDAHHQRDLLLAIIHRMGQLDRSVLSYLDERLLSGPAKWNNEGDEEFIERRAGSTLSRLHWLSSQGYKFTFDLEEKAKILRLKAPRWKPAFADTAVESLESRSGSVSVITDHSSLIDAAIDAILSRAEEMSGRTDFLVEKDPYAGLSAELPVRAFSALTHAAKRGEFPGWAWRTFLYSETRKTDRSRLIESIARRLMSYSDHDLAEIMSPASSWLRAVSKFLATHSPAVFEAVTLRLIKVLRYQSASGSTAIVRHSKEPDWIMEAINSPTGRIAEVIFEDLRVKELNAGEGFPADWLIYPTSLLALDHEVRRLGMVLLFRNLSWFFSIDPRWTKKELLPFLDSDHDGPAAWAGFLWSARIPYRQLFLELKPRLLQRAANSADQHSDSDRMLASFLLAGWGSTKQGRDNRYISNEELREALLKGGDEFRSRVLWQAQNWAEADVEAEDGKWHELIPELLINVWPRQLSAKSPSISARLCDLAFANEKLFPKIAVIILPLLTKIDHDHLFLPHLYKSGDGLVDRYPREALALLHAVLPDNPQAWPYGIDATLSRIGDADANLNVDDRLIALKRRWYAR